MAKHKSPRAHSQVIEAAVALFAERGLEATSMDAIAKASGVSKATIYRHWPAKDSLCLEVLSYLHGFDKEPPVFDSGDFRADLIAQLQHDPAADRRVMRERIMPHLMAYAAHNRVFGDAWRSRVIEPARKALGKEGHCRLDDLTMRSRTFLFRHRKGNLHFDLREEIRTGGDKDGRDYGQNREIEGSIELPCAD